MSGTMFAWMTIGALLLGLVAPTRSDANDAEEKDSRGIRRASLNSSPKEFPCRPRLA